ncbi:MAG TPA: outer membrane lipoprotein carrier protein LolA [Terriglobales bacterium]|nr:outer membrane lipoprotein carrier protein LolA [Terriglobales bacterium]
MSFPWALIILLIAPAFNPVAAKQQPSSSVLPPIHEIAKAVDQHYNQLRTLVAEFTEIYQGNGMSREESGTLWLKKPGKMRWEYRQPRQKLFISDAKTAWFYVPGERQARKLPVKKLEDLRSPIGYLLGKTKLEREFAGLSLAPDVSPIHSEDLVLRGVPKFMEGVSQVLLEVTPDRKINRIVVDLEDGSTTEYRLGEQKENIVVGDQQFRFSLPPDVEVIQGDLGENAD